jgi:hypothetical protein
VHLWVNGTECKQYTYNVILRTLSDIKIANTFPHTLDLSMSLRFLWLYRVSCTYPINRKILTYIQIRQTTKCNNFSSLLLDVYVLLNMFRASSCPSSGAQQLQYQPLVLLLERGGSSAVGRGGPANSTATTTFQQ